jgi:hypothetical protein
MRKKLLTPNRLHELIGLGILDSVFLLLGAASALCILGAWAY